MKRIVIILVLCGSAIAQAQLWSGIIDPARAIDWTGAGVVGGIPTDYPDCTTGACNTLWNNGVDGTQVTAANIQSAINSLPGTYAGRAVVRIPGNGAVTRDISTTINLKNYVIVRGMGADKTLLHWTGQSGCLGSQSAFCLWGGSSIYYGASEVQPGGANAFTWTAGFAKGTTQITITSVGTSGIQNGEYIYLDQAEDQAVTSGFFICSNAGAGCSSEGNDKGRLVSSLRHPQVQIVQVTAGCVSRCTGTNGGAGFSITISPGLYATNWALTHTPGGYFPGVAATIQYAGVENLSADTRNIEAGSGSQSVTFLNAANCWIKGTRLLRSGPESVVFLQNTSHITVADNYLYGGGTGGVTNYGVEPFFASDSLVINNIGHRSGALVTQGMGTGNVFAYNFSINQPRSPDTWMSQEIWEHDSGTLYNLYEGNIGAGIVADVYHGNTVMTTAFRNRFTGTDTGSMQNTVAVSLWSFNRYHNFIANVLGNAASTTYQATVGNGGSNTIFGLGDGNGQVANDSVVATTLMRWGNYDTVNGAVRWVTGEVPSGISPYPNAVPTTSCTSGISCPNSFFLNNKPLWFGSVAWPSIGPEFASDISLITNPAQSCALNVMGMPADGSGSVLAFNAADCYSYVPFSNPNIPQSLQCTVVASATKSAARGTVKVCTAAASPGGFNKPETLYATLPTAYVHNYITPDTQPNPICDFSGGFTEDDVTLSTLTPAGLQTAINLWQGGNRRIKVPATSVLSGTSYTTFQGTSPLGFAYSQEALVAMKVISSPTGCLLIESGTPPTRATASTPRTICADYPPNTDRPRDPNCTEDVANLWTIRQDEDPGNASNASIYFPPGSNHIIVRDMIATIGPGTSQSNATNGQGHGRNLVVADPESHDIALEYSWVHGWNPGDANQPTSHAALNSDGTCKNWTHTGTATTDANGTKLIWASGDRFGMDWSDGDDDHLYGQTYVSPQATVYLGSTTWHSGTAYLIAEHDPADMSDMTCSNGGGPGTGNMTCGDKVVTLASAATPNTTYSFNLTNPIASMVPGCGDDVSNGVIWYCDNCWIMWSQINKIHYWQTESHSLLMGFQNGPVKVAHNNIEPASGGIFLGGGAVDVSRLGPVNNFEDRNNFIGNDLMEKYLSAAQGTSPGPPWGCGPLDAGEALAATHDTCPFQWSKKAIQEFKFCKKCLVDGNIFQGDWTDGQQICLSFPPRSCSGGAVCEQIDANGLPRIGISDITFSNNWLNNCEQGIGIGSRSDGPGNGGGPSFQSARFDVVNNVFSNFDPEQFGAPYNNMSNGLIELGDNGQSYRCPMSITSGIVHAGPCEAGWVTGPGTNTQIDRIVRTGTPGQKDGVVTVEFSNRHDPLVGGTLTFTENGTYAGTAVFDGTFTIGDGIANPVENDIDGTHETRLCEFDSSTVHEPWKNSTNQPCVGYTGRYADTLKYKDTINTQVASTDTLCNKTGGPTCSASLLGTDSLAYQTLAFSKTDITQQDPILVFSGTYADDGGNNHHGGVGCKNADGTSNTGRALDYYTWDTTAKHPRNGVNGSLPLAGCAAGGTPCTDPSGMNVYYQAYGSPADDNSGVVCYVDNGAGGAHHVTIQNNTIVNSSALAIHNNALTSQQRYNIVANNVYVSPDASTGSCAAKKSFFTVPNVASVCEGNASTASFDRATSAVFGNVLMGRSQTYWTQFPSENPANVFPVNYAAVGFATTKANQAAPCDKSLAPFGCPQMSLPFSTAASPLTLDDLVISGAYFGKGANITWVKAAESSNIYTGVTPTANGPFKDAP